MRRQYLIQLICGLSLFAFLLVVPNQAKSMDDDLELLQKYRSTLPVAGKGLELLAAGDREGASRKFAGCLDVFPSHPAACYGQAVISSREGDLIQALAWIEKAEAGCLSLQVIWEEQMAKRMNMSREEQLRFREMVTQGVDRTQNSVWCDTTSLIYNKRGRQTEDVLQGGDSDSSPFAIPAEYYVLHGNILFKQRRFTGAEEKYLLALTVAPAHRQCLNNLVNLYFITRRFERAREWLQKARQRKVTINPRLEQAVKSAG